MYLSPRPVPTLAELAIEALARREHRQSLPPVPGDSAEFRRIAHLVLEIRHRAAGGQPGRFIYR